MKSKSDFTLFTFHYFMNDDTKAELTAIADELRTIAAFGLNFSRSEFDVERFEGVLKASARLTAVLQAQSQEQPQTADELFAAYKANHFAVGPMASGEAVVLRGNEILLVRRGDDGLWALPGGITDPGETLAQSAVRELREEAGIVGKAVELLGVFDSRIWHSEKKIHFYHAVFLIEAENDVPEGNEEVTAVRYFAEQNLPPLSPGHHLRVPFVFEQLRGGGKRPFFD